MKNGTIIARINGGVFLLAAGFVMCRAVLQIGNDARAVMVFQKTVGTVTEYIAPNKAADSKMAGGQLAFDYRVDGSRYSSRLEHSESPGTAWKGRLLAIPHHTGEPIDVYFDPSNPAVCTLQLAINTERFGQLTFLAPFALVGYLALRMPHRFDRSGDGAGHKDFPRGTLYVIVYAVFSLIGGFGLAATADSVDWRFGIVLGIVVPMVLIPLAAYLLVHVAYDPPIAAPNMQSRRRAVGVSKRRRIAIYLGVASFFWWAISSIFLIDLGISLVQCHQAHQRYVAAKGIITKSAVAAIPDEADLYRPVVIYGFSVGRERLQGDQLNLGKFYPTGPQSSIRQICDRYPVHSAVTVYYDPFDPRRAVLDLDFMKYYAFHLFGLSAFVIAGIGLTVAAVRFALSESEDALPGLPPRASLIGVSWFVSHVVSVLALGFSGCDQPDRAAWVWLGVATVALTVITTSAVVLRRRTR